MWNVDETGISKQCLQTCNIIATKGVKQNNKRRKRGNRDSDMRYERSRTAYVPPMLIWPRKREIMLCFVQCSCSVYASRRADSSSLYPELL